MTEVSYLRDADLEAAVSPREAIAAIESAFGEARDGDRSPGSRLRIPLADRFVHVMPAVVRPREIAGVKVGLGHRTGVPCAFLLFGGRDFELLALMEARWLGLARTAAASAVAAKYLARSDSTSMGIIGTGPVAEAHVEYLKLAIPTIKQVVVHGRTPAHVREFCDRVGARVAADAEEAASQEIVVVATNAREPVLLGGWLQPGSFACAVGANWPDARELDDDVLRRAAFVCCDSRGQAAIEAADLIEPVSRGVLDWSSIHELADVVTGRVRPRFNGTDITLFKSVGVALEDLALAAYAYRKMASLSTKPVPTSDETAASRQGVRS